MTAENTVDVAGMSPDDIKALAQAELFQAQAEQARAETKWHRQETRKARAEAVCAELEAEDAVHAREWADACDDNHRVHTIKDTINAQSVKSCLSDLNRWHRIDPGCDITIVINSPGGDVFHGLHLCDTIEALAEQGHTITTRVEGVAASMAGVIAQVGQIREIGRNSRLHLHEVSTGSFGKAAELSDTAELAKSLTMQICEIYARRGKKSARQILRMFERTEVYLTAEQALAEGFVDRIA